MSERYDSPLEETGPELRIRAVFVFFIATLVAFIATGLTEGVTTPAQRGMAVDGLSRDGWLGETAVITVPHFMLVRHSLIWELDPWRPLEEGATEISFIGCGIDTIPRPFAREQGSQDTLTISIPLESRCAGESISVHFSKPFKPKGDERQLGGKLVSVSLQSALGPPLIASRLVLRWLFGALLFLSLFLTPRFSSRGRFAAAVLCGGAVCIASLLGVGADRSEQLALLLGGLSLIGCGAQLVSLARGDAEAAPASEGRGNLGSVAFTLDRRAIYVLAGITAVGGALRLSGVEFGLPSFYHPDEPVKTRVVAKMLATGSFNPQYFLHPSLLLYLTALLSTLGTWLGLTAMDVATLPEIVLSGRIVSCIAGTATISVVGLLGMRLLGKEAGLLAAGLVAVSPLHITCSRYLKEDALLLLWVVGVVYLIFRSLEAKSARIFLAAGACAGLAIGSKYTGLLTLLPLVATPWLAQPAVLALLFSRRDESQRHTKLSVRELARPAPELLRMLPCAIAAAGVVFFITSPFVVLDADRFLRDFQTERQHMLGGHRGVEISAWSQLWTYHLERSLVPGFGAAALVLALLGLGYLVRFRTAIGMLLVGTFLLMYLPAEWVRAKPPPQPERYALGCIPFLALAAGSLLQALSRTYLLTGVMCAAVALAFPGAKSVLLAVELHDDTRQEMREWMIANVPQGSKVLLEGSYAPRLRGTTFETRMLRADLDPDQITGRKLDASGFDYLLLTSFSYGSNFTEPKGNELLRRRYQRIFDRYPLLHRSVAMSGSYGFHNPELRLYDLRHKGRMRSRVVE